MSAAPTFTLAPEILAMLRSGRQAREREVQGGPRPPVNETIPPAAESSQSTALRDSGETVDVVDLLADMPTETGDQRSQGDTVELSQGGESVLMKRSPKKRIRKRWAGLSSVQVRLRFPGHVADRLGDIPPKQKARLIAFLLSAEDLQIDLEALSSDGLRGELIRLGCNLNQAIRLLHRGEGESANLVTSVEAALSWLARLRKAGCL